MNNMNLRIHVAPVGFEVDRIVLSAKKRRADKVYLMVDMNPSRDKADKFAKKARRELEAADIEVEEIAHNRMDLFSIIKTVRMVIERERENFVYVNLASGSKIQAIGGMMASMMFNESNNVVPFYAEAERYTELEKQEDVQEITKGIREIIDIPSYEIQKPSGKLIKALSVVRDVDRGMRGPDKRIRKKDMAKACIDNYAIEGNPDRISNAEFASLDKNIIQPLKNDWKFISEEKAGRTRWISLTREGRNAAEFLVLDDDAAAE